MGGAERRMANHRHKKQCIFGAALREDSIIYSAALDRFCRIAVWVWSKWLAIFALCLLQRPLEDYHCQFLLRHRPTPNSRDPAV
jgi:hypothetical protein